jgi:acetylornithine aminotransferase
MQSFLIAKRETRLSHPDPANDSHSAALVNSHSDYLLTTYSRPPLVFVKGEGSYLWDLENRKYIDFSAGIAVVALGHADRSIAQLLYDQATQLNHCSNLFHSPWPGELAKLIIETTKKHSPHTPFQKVFIANSGTEANEAALKFARKVGKQRGGDGKTDIVCFDRGFHGRTFGALSVTPQPKYQKPFAPMVPGVNVGKLNDLKALDTLVDNKTCGVIVEPIQGEGGVYEATEEFLAALRERCNQVGAVLIYDEIQVHPHRLC